MHGTSNCYVASTLRKDFQDFFRYLHTQHPIWLYKCKFLRLIKGRLGFPPKTKSPSGATAGGIPPKKLSHFFAKNRA
jgi:hypothetical protein